jgi:hypothetical protein
VAKPNVAGIEIEQLETRCLLNGAGYAAALLGPAHASGFDPAAQARLKGSEVAGFNRVDIHPVHVGAPGRPDGPGGPRGPSGEGHVHPPAPFLTFADETIAVSYLPAAASNQGSDMAPVLLPEYTAQYFPKRTPAAATTVEGEPPSSKTNAPTIPLSQAGKGDNTNSASVRDANAVIVPKGTPNFPVLAKEDRVVTGPLDSVRSAAADKAQFSLQGYVIEPRAAAASTSEARAQALQQFLAAGTADMSDAFLGSGEETASACPLLTGVLPFDFASLEVSIQDFFSQINQAGIKLSESLANLLFSSGVLAVAATLAVEISRRKTAALAQVPALDYVSAIPYSDY